LEGRGGRKEEERRKEGGRKEEGAWGVIAVPQTLLGELRYNNFID
jgi:hypothetical protein